MAAPFPCSFSKSIEKFKARLSDEQKASFSVTSLQDVERSIQEIQDRLGPEKRLRRFGRIRKFLEGMKQIEELVKIFLNVHEVVAFVWGPIKLVLMIAATRIDTIDLLLGVYEDIGEVIYGLKKYDRLFRNHEDVRHVLGIYFHDVLEFHYCVLDVFARPAWKRFFDSAWPTFRARFKPIIESLTRHRALLADEKVTAVIEEVQSSRNKLDELSENVKQGLEKLKTEIGKEILDLHNSSVKQKSALVARFEPPDYEADQQSVGSHRTSTKSGDWVFSDLKFKNWTQSSTSSDNILYLSGGPGSGKTTLVSKIIDRMRVQRTHLNEPVVFFYFSHRDASKASMAAMLRALIVQTVNQDDTTLEFLHQKCGSMSNTEILNLSTLKELMSACMTMQRRLWVILDGLDETENQHNGSQEACKILEWFRNAMGSGRQANQVRLLIAGQRDGHIDRVLSPYPEIKLEAVTSHDEDIREYSIIRAEAIKERFSLEGSEETKIIKMVTDTSKGMFLYAKVVLDNLFAQDSLCEFEDEMASDNFPADLEKAYHRTIIRVLEKPAAARQKSAVTILGWVLCSPRPLRWREIQSRFCINANTGICNFKNRRIDSCKILCGSFIEEDPCERYEDVLSELSIRLVHETAGKYLVHTGRINLLEEHARNALFCCRYLTSPPFESSLERSVVEETATSGYYGFLDYAVAYSYHHAEFLTTKTDLLERQLHNEVRDNVSNMLECYQPQEVITNEINESHEQERHELELLLGRWRAAQSDISSILETRIGKIRQIQESQRSASPRDSAKIPLLELEGPRVFKCPKIFCHNFANGFSNQDERDDHVKEHERPFKCHEQDCHARIIGFPSPLKLEEHRRRFHSEEIQPPVFAVPQGTDASKLYSACSSGNLETVKFLVMNSNSLRKEQLSCALGHGAKGGHTFICKYLIECGADVRLTFQNRTPISQAIKHGNLDFFLWLWRTAGLKIEDITVSSEHYYLCIAQAIHFEAGEILEYLVKDKSTTEMRDAVQPVLQKMCAPETVLGKVAQPINEITALLHSFFKLAYPDLYGTAAKMVAPPLFGQREDENYALDSSNWHFQLTRTDESFATTQFHRSLLWENYALANFFLDLVSANYLQMKNSEGSMPLHGLFPFKKEATHIARDIARRIVQIDGGASANSKDNDGNMPLSLACRWAHCAGVFDILIESTVNLDLRNNRMESPLDIAVDNNNLEATTELLATKRVNLSSENKSGRTAFSLAAETHYVPNQILELLYSADPTLAVRADSSVQQLTPLHYASRDYPIGSYQAEKTLFLLTLPEVDLLVEGYCKVDWPDKLQDLERLCQFAESHGLSDALAALSRHKDKMELEEKVILRNLRRWEDY